MIRTELLQNAKPILFNAEMVRALLEGRKTVTRRVVKPQPPATSVIRKRGFSWDWSFWADCDMGHLILPPYQPEDTLWVRETFRVDYLSNIPGNGRVQYKDGTYMDIQFASERYDMMRRAHRKPGWRPNENMPREAARLFLRVKAVRVERLQEITDYRAEGIQPSEACEACFAVCGGCMPSNSPTGCDNEIETFANLWDSTIKPADRPIYGWEANPWVWVIKFERMEPMPEPPKEEQP